MWLLFPAAAELLVHTIPRPLAPAHTPVLCIYCLFPVEFFLTALLVLFVEHFRRVFLGCLSEAQGSFPMMLTMPLFYACLLLFLNYRMFIVVFYPFSTKS